MRVKWDEEKNVANQRKHGISFGEAAELFTTGVEDRFIAIGPITRGLVLVVWTEREGDVVRIISARWASKHEEGLYSAYKDTRS